MVVVVITADVFAARGVDLVVVLLCARYCWLAGWFIGWLVS